MANILWITKRYYMNKDLINDEFGRYFELPYHLSKQYNKVYVLALSYRKGEDRVKKINDNLFFESVQVKNFRKYIIQICNTINEKAINLIVGASDSIYCIMSYFFGKLYKIPVVFDIYDDFDKYASIRFNPLLKMLYYHFLKSTHANIVFTESLSNFLKDKSPNPNYHVIPNGVDKNLFQPMDKRTCRNMFNFPDKLLIGHFGGISNAKRGIEQLFSSSKILNEMGVDHCLVLAGEKKYKAEELNRSKNILYLGSLPQKQIPFLINACDVNVVCYKNDEFANHVFPFKIAEYISCNVPFLAPNVGPMPEFLKNHQEYLYEVDNPHSLAKKIYDISKDKKKKKFPHVKEWKELAYIYNKLISNILRIHTSQKNH